jgi:hypothetical protein
VSHEFTETLPRSIMFEAVDKLKRCALSAMYESDKRFGMQTLSGWNIASYRRMKRPIRAGAGLQQFAGIGRWPPK